MARTAKSYKKEIKKLKNKYETLRMDYLLMIDANKKAEYLITSYRNVVRDLMENDGDIDEFIDVESEEGQEMIEPPKNEKFDNIYIN